MSINVYFLIITLSLTLMSCSTTESFTGEFGQTTYESTCNGTIRTMSDCYKLATTTCPNGYKIVDKQITENIVIIAGNITPISKRSLFYYCL